PDAKQPHDLTVPPGRRKIRFRADAPIDNSVVCACCRAGPPRPPDDRLQFLEVQMIPLVSRRRFLRSAALGALAGAASGGPAFGAPHDDIPTGPRAPQDPSVRVV